MAATKVWIAAAYARERFGGLQAHSSHSERRRVVALLLAMTDDAPYLLATWAVEANTSVTKPSRLKG
jgi:hypothetical protein